MQLAIRNQGNTTWYKCTTQYKHTEFHVWVASTQEFTDEGGCIVTKMSEFIVKRFG